MFDRVRTLILIAQMLRSLLCQFTDYCESQEECPDGICEGLRADLTELDSATTTAPGSVRAVAIKPDWSRLPELIDQIRATIALLLEFLGSQRKVG